MCYSLITIYHQCWTPQAILHVSKWYVCTNSLVPDTNSLHPSVRESMETPRSTAQCPGGKSDVQKDQKMDCDLQVPHHTAGLQKFQSQVHLHCLGHLLTISVVTGNTTTNFPWLITPHSYWIILLIFLLGHYHRDWVNRDLYEVSNDKFRICPFPGEFQFLNHQSRALTMPFQWC